VGIDILQSTNLCHSSHQSVVCEKLIGVFSFRLHVQQALNEKLHKSSAPRADGSVAENFRFTNLGMGNVPVEILNLRRNSQSWSRTLGDVHFNRVSSSYFLFLRRYKIALT